MRGISGPRNWTIFRSSRVQEDITNGDTKHPTQLAYFSDSGLIESMRRELLNLGTWYTWTEPGTFQEMFLSNKNFLECYTHIGQTWRCSGAGSRSIQAGKIRRGASMRPIPPVRSKESSIHRPDISRVRFPRTFPDLIAMDC